MEIVWAKSALNSLGKIYEYIYENSPQNADHIIDEIADKVTGLGQHPERYKPDNYKRNNTGNYRAFEHKRVRKSKQNQNRNCASKTYQAKTAGILIHFSNLYCVPRSDNQ